MECIREAGWPVFPVLALGLTALAVALRHALMPERSLSVLAVGLMLSSLLMAVLGTALGIDATVDGITHVEPERRWIFLVGLKESLRNLEVGFGLALPTALALTAGSYRLRLARRPASPSNT